LTDKRTLLLIDNNPAHAKELREAVLEASEGPFEGEVVETLAQGLERLRKQGIWAVFANLSLPDSQGLNTFIKLRDTAPGVPTLILGGADQKGVVEQAMRDGAKDYLLEGHIDTYSFVRAIRNMAERKAAEEVLFTEMERAQVTLNSIGDAVLSTDMSGNVTYLNIVAEQMTGWSSQEARGKPLAEVFHIINGDTRELAPNPMESAVQTNSTVELSANCILIRRDGSESSIEDSAAPIHDRSGAISGAVIVFHDVSMSKSIREEMSRLAQHDGLTGLPNRIVLVDRLTQAIATARRNRTRVGVMYMDLDGFKQINDALGHSAGDSVLKSVAMRVVGCVRGSDTVCRQGGDEFVVLLSEISHAGDASIAARKVLNALTTLPGLGETNLQVTVSIGISTYPEDGEDAETLITNADTAMYKAKEMGRNTYHFHAKDKNVLAVDPQSIAGDLRPHSGRA
jgi:diguanylate cyclase (GGDEF)-like protein/PAS domain S-box-containing protein